MRFWDLKIWQHWDFASAPVTKIHVTRSIFEIEGSSFGFSLIFVCSKNHILQLKVSDRFFNDLIFYTPLPKGGRIKNLNSNLVQNFCFKYSGKVRRLWFNIYMRIKAINKNAYAPPPTFYPIIWIFLCYQFHNQSSKACRTLVC